MSVGIALALKAPARARSKFVVILTKTLHAPIRTEISLDSSSLTTAGIAFELTTTSAPPWMVTLSSPVVAAA